VSREKLKIVHLLAELIEPNKEFLTAVQCFSRGILLGSSKNASRYVRELLHSMEAAMVLSEGPCLLPEHLPACLHDSRPTTKTSSSNADAMLPTLQEAERAHIRQALEASRGHRGNAARILGISERNLYRKLREHDLSS
jgi:transcriptional regulator with GAF, ATPase, and Fis domain